MAGMYGITVPGGSRSSPFNPMKAFGQQQAPGAPRPFSPPAMPGMGRLPQFNFARQPTAQPNEAQPQWMPKQATPPAPSGGSLQTILNSLTPNVQPGQAAVAPPAGWNGQPSAPVVGATNSPFAAGVPSVRPASQYNLNPNDPLLYAQSSGLAPANSGGLFSLANTAAPAAQPAAQTTTTATTATATPAAQATSSAPVITAKGTLAANDPYILANPEFRDVNVTTPEGRAMMAARMLMNGTGGTGGAGDPGDSPEARAARRAADEAREAQTVGLGPAAEALRSRLDQQLGQSDIAYNEMVKAIANAKLSQPDYVSSMIAPGIAQGPTIRDSIDGNEVLRRDLYYGYDLASQIRQALNEGKTFDTSKITDPTVLAAIQKYQNLYGTLPRFGNSIYSPGFVPSSIIDQGLMKMANQ